MDLEIGELTSMVQTADSQALLQPQVLERIKQEVLRALREEQAYEQRVAEERRLRSGVSTREETVGE